jgi:hypothetical protein
MSIEPVASTTARPTTPCCWPPATSTISTCSVGNEAWADAANPTIGIGTKDNSTATSPPRCSPSRASCPRCSTRSSRSCVDAMTSCCPAWNCDRSTTVWSGITRAASIQARSSTPSTTTCSIKTLDGVVNAEDAGGCSRRATATPTAITSRRQRLLLPAARSELRLGAAHRGGHRARQAGVGGLQDERKFAAAAARRAQRAADLRSHLAQGLPVRSRPPAGRTSPTPGRTPPREIVPTTRYWGMDHWASRTGQGSYLNWVIGNAILPDVDPDPTHAGIIQKVDRTTVPELKELPSCGGELADGPRQCRGQPHAAGLPESSVPFDLNPNTVVDVGGHALRAGVRPRHQGAGQTPLCGVSTTPRMSPG